MADIGEDFELGEVIVILGAVGLGVYLLYKLGGSISDYFKKSLCLSNVGAIPGVTGATEAQSKAPQIAAQNLPAGGSVIWSAGADCSDFDYAKPCGDVVQVRHSFWGQLTGTPVTYTTVPRDSYVRPAGGTTNPAFACCYGCTIPASAAGFPACCGGAFGGGGGGGF